MVWGGVHAGRPRCDHRLPRIREFLDQILPERILRRISSSHRAVLYSTCQSLTTPSVILTAYPQHPCFRHKTHIRCYELGQSASCVHISLMIAHVPTPAAEPIPLAHLRQSKLPASSARLHGSLDHRRLLCGVYLPQVTFGGSSNMLGL